MVKQLLVPLALVVSSSVALAQGAAVDTALLKEIKAAPSHVVKRPLTSGKSHLKSFGCILTLEPNTVHEGEEFFAAMQYDEPIPGNVRTNFHVPWLGLPAGPDFTFMELESGFRMTLVLPEGSGLVGHGLHFRAIGVEGTVPVHVTTTTADGAICQVSAELTVLPDPNQAK